MGCSGAQAHEEAAPRARVGASSSESGDELGEELRDPEGPLAPHPQHHAPRWRPRPHDPGELPRWIGHHSVPHDTLEALALRYGVSLRKLRKWNGLSPRARLPPRERRVLRVRARRFPPPRERLIHQVVAGDTWSSIAREYGVLPGRLRAWNQREPGSTLVPGEPLELWIEPWVYAAILDDRPANQRAAMIRPGGHSIGTPQAGRLVAAVSIPPGHGYEVLYPHSAWGTTWAVRKLTAALDEFHEQSGYEEDLFVGVMSRRRGGRVGGHISHQSGRDVDIRLPVREGLPHTRPVTARRVDWQATWALIEALADTGAITIILLDYGAQRRLDRAAKAAGAGTKRRAELIQFPRGSKASRGLVRHSKGHEGHIHVRFTCGPHEPECGDLL